MFKIIKQNTNKITDREYFNKLYLIPADELSFFKYEQIIEEAVEDIVSNMESYLNESDDFKLSHHFKINILLLNDYNELNKMIQKALGSWSLISYRRMSGIWEYLFIGETTDNRKPLNLDISETYPENMLNIEKTYEHFLREDIKDFIYLESEKFKLHKFKIKLLLSGLFPS